MKSRTRLNNTYRGFLGILCLLLFATIKVEAKTNSELKEYLEIEDESSIEDEENIKYRLETNESEIDKYNREKEEEEEKKQKLEVLKDEFSQKNVEIGVMLRNSESAYNIINEIEELKNINNSILETEMDKIDEKSIKEDIESTVYKSSEDILSKWYDIGVIGSSLKPCVDTFIIEKPYGYKSEYNYKTDKYTKIEDKHTGITLKSNPGDNVYAQFNGIIYSIEKDSEDKNKLNVNIYHGDNTYTIYKGLSNSTKIAKGDTVSQYKVIGNSESNTIEFEVIIDNNYINPLLIYGKSGMNYYLNFLSNSNEHYLVGKNEMYFLEK